MQSSQEVQTGRFLQFLFTAGVVAGQTPFNGWDAFVVAAVLWVIAWLGARMASSAISRLGGKAWSLLIQLGLLFAAFIWLAPGGYGLKLLVVWGIAVPLVFMGAIGRRLHALCEGCPKSVSRWARDLVLACGAAVFIYACFVEGLYMAVIGAGLLSLAIVPAFYGWLLAETPVLLRRDARFGNELEFNSAGVARDL